jgi:glycosyltransferase involved in cell wall biosynthesis
MYPKTPLPLVTIAIPCYNEGDFIERAVSSALGQTYANIEVVISDSGSHDHTLEFLSQAALKHNVRVLYQKKGTSKYENWTGMIEASMGEYILILPARHFLYAEAITRLIKPFIKNHDRNLAYVRGCMVYELSDGKKSKYIPSQMSSLIEGSEELQQLRLANTCETVVTLYHLDKLKQSLPFNTHFERTFVWLQNAKLASKWPVYFVNADVGEWTICESPEQISLKTNKAIAEIPALLETFATFDPSVGLKPDPENYRGKLSSETNAIPKASIGSIIRMKCKNYLPRPILTLAMHSLFYARQLMFRVFPEILGR